MKHVLHLAALSAVIALGGLATDADAKTGRDRMTFEQLDANADGKITQDELRARGAARFAAADADGDQSLTLEELKASMRARSDVRAEKMMARLDANDDGALSKEEVSAGRPGKRAGRGFERADTNGDGALDKAEFEAAQARFKERRKSRNSE